MFILKAIVITRRKLQINSYEITYFKNKKFIQLIISK
jgi:hypothetical protein